MNAEPTVVLFDIDGTLVSTGGAGRRAMERAFVDVAGSAEPLSQLSFGGMTDFSIVRITLRHLDRSDEMPEVQRVLDRYVELLPKELEETDTYVVHTGVREMLAALQPYEHLAIGLGTGNIERGARLKLGVGDLNEHFDFGGFGCDAEERAELIRSGAARGAARLGEPLERCRVVVIGDTVRDVQAALAIGASCLAVGTGGAQLSDLKGAGATWVAPDLAASGLIEPLIGTS